MKVKSLQRPGTEAIRTQIQPSKSKREITKITNSQNTQRRYGLPSEQLFRKRWLLSNSNRNKLLLKHIKRNVTDTLTPKTGTRQAQQNYRLGMNYPGGGGGAYNVLRRQPRPQFLKLLKHLVLLFASHDNPLTRQ